jgi:nitrogen-specific signal transduction histidine kinase/DNA-binding response OmpR family regulator
VINFAETTPEGSFDPREVTPAPVLLITPRGRIAWMNKAAERFLGPTAPALIGESFVTLISLAQREAHVRALLRQHVHAAEAFSLELPVRTMRNANHWVGLQVQRTDLPGGRWAYVACFVDLQPIHQALELLKRQNAQLVATARQSAAASEMKSEFLAAISNELRPPLRGVLDMARVLLETALDRDQRMVAEILQDSAGTIVDLLDDMVDFTRIESGQMETVALDFDVRLAADAVGATIAAEADSRGVRFRFHLHHDVPAHLSADPGRLRQVLLQIGRACVTSVEKQAGVLTLLGEPGCETAYGIELDFTFRFDPDGAGEGQVPGLFAALASGDVRASVAHGGLGLSLAIAHHLIGLLGGRTALQHLPTGGWAVKVSLPFAKQVGLAGRLHEEEFVNLADRPILALAEDGGLWDSLQASMRFFGARVERAPNGPAALQAMRTAAGRGAGFAAVIVHLEMDGLDAARFARALRRQEDLQSTPLLLVASLGRSGDSILATEWGYSGYLSEPVSSDLLRQTLEATIRQHRAAAAINSAGTLVTRYSLAEESKGRRCVLIVNDNILDQLALVSALRKMGYRSQVLGNKEDVLGRIRAGAGSLVILPFGDDWSSSRDLVRSIRSLEESIRGVPILAVAPPVGSSSTSALASLDVDGIVDADIEIGELCSAIERLLLHGTIGAIETEDIGSLPETVGDPTAGARERRTT